MNEYQTAFLLLISFPFNVTSHFLLLACAACSQKLGEYNICTQQWFLVVYGAGLFQSLPLNSRIEIILKFPFLYSHLLRVQMSQFKWNYTKYIRQFMSKDMFFSRDFNFLCKFTIIWWRNKNSQLFLGIFQTSLGNSVW